MLAVCACCVDACVGGPACWDDQRFWTEVHDGAKLFYFSGLEKSGRYPKTEVHNLARFISVAKFRPLIWRNTHPSVPFPPSLPRSSLSSS